MSNGTNTPYGLLTNISGIGNGGTQKLTAYNIYADPTGTITQPTSIYSGDPVKLVSNPGVRAMTGTICAEFLNQAANNAPAPAVAIADAFIGTFVSCSYQLPNGTLLQNMPYWPGGNSVMAGSTITALVNDDPMVVYKVQVSSSTAQGNVIFNNVFTNNLQSMVGLNVDLAVGGLNFVGPNVAYTNNPGTGSNSSGVSAYYLDLSTITVGAGNNLDNDMKIIGLAPSSSLFINPTGANPALVAGVNLPFVEVLVRFNIHMFGPYGTPQPTPGV